MSDDAYVKLVGTKSQVCQRKYFWGSPYNVCLEVTSLCEGEVALFGNKRLHPTVSQHVGFQIKSFDA